MLDTSIRTEKVYVMNVKSITDRYNRALGYTPAVAALVATLTLFINFFVPLFVGFSTRLLQVASRRAWS